jgi:hypothetical protein
MATVFEPVRPVPPMRTIFMVYPSLHRAGETEAGGALQLTEPVLDVVEVDHRDALETGGIGAAAPDGRPAGVPGVGEPVVVGAKDCRHQQRVRHFK